MESDSIRARRLEIAQEEAIAQKLGSTHLIGVQGAPQIDEPETARVDSPIEGACYDALVYLREGMSRQEVIEAILMRNRVTRTDADKIVDEVIEQNKKDQNAIDNSVNGNN